MESRHGWFPRYKDIIRKHFGLDVWVTHSLSKERFYEDSTRFTTACVTLPTTTSASEHWNQVGIDIKDRLCHEKERFYEINFTPPSQPLEKSLARFGRAMKILELKPLALAEVTRSAYIGEAAREGEDGSDGEASDSEGSIESDIVQVEGREYGTASRLLIRNKPYQVAG